LEQRPRISAFSITSGIRITRPVDGRPCQPVDTLAGMETYHVLASGTVLWLLASGGATDSHLPLILAASLTAGALVGSRLLRGWREKL
jgi:hypothetical protein